ncbi:MAG: tetratricopeptide repeat protein [Chitinophagaceae bacterium]
MSKYHIAFIVSFIVIAIGLYFGGNFTGKKNKSTAQSTENKAFPNATKDIVATDIQAYEKEIVAKLKTTQLDKEKKLTQIAKENQNAVAFKDLAEFWEAEKDLNLAAYYYKKAAFLENTEKSLNFAGNLFLAILGRTEKPQMRKWQALEAIESFNKVLELNPNNTDTKIALATCYIDGTGETMNGVSLLRDITQKDSNNISANIILGKLGIQSGQFDKAIKRLEKVLSLRPENTEALYFLAEAYKGTGNKEKAIELFEQCKKLVNNPDFSKEIDKYINTFN